MVDQFRAQEEAERVARLDAIDARYSLAYPDRCPRTEATAEAQGDDMREQAIAQGFRQIYHLLDTRDVTSVAIMMVVGEEELARALDLGCRLVHNSPLNEEDELPPGVAPHAPLHAPPARPEPRVNRVTTVLVAAATRCPSQSLRILPYVCSDQLARFVPVEIAEMLSSSIDRQRAGATGAELDALMGAEPVQAAVEAMTPRQRVAMAEIMRRLPEQPAAMEAALNSACNRPAAEVPGSSQAAVVPAPATS